MHREFLMNRSVRVFAFFCVQFTMWAMEAPKISHYEQFVDQDSESLYFLGIKLYHNGATALAKTVLEKAVRFPAARTNIQAFKFKTYALYSLGVIAEEENEYDQAEQCWTLAIRSGLASPATYNKLGLLLMRRKEYDRACELFDKAAQLGDSSACADRELCVALLASNKPADKLSLKNSQGDLQELLVPNGEHKIQADKLLSSVKENAQDTEAIGVKHLDNKKKRKKTHKKKVITQESPKEEAKSWYEYCTIENQQQYQKWPPFFSPDNSLLVMSIDKGIKTVSLSDTNVTSAYLLPSTEESPLSLVHWDSATKQLYGLTYNTIHVWDINRPGEPLYQLSIPSHVAQGHLVGAAFSEDGTLLVTVYDNFNREAPKRSLIVWNIKNNTLQLYRNIGLRLKELPTPIRDVYFSKSKERLFILAGQKTLITYTFAGSSPVRVELGSDSVYQHPLMVYFNRTTTRVAVRLDDTIQIVDLKSIKPLQVIKEHAGPIFWAAFSPDDKFLATASYDRTVKLWGIDTGTCLCTLSGSSSLCSVEFSSCGQWLVAQEENGKIKIWRLEKLKPVEQDDIKESPPSVEPPKADDVIFVVVDYQRGRSYSAVGGEIIVRKIEDSAVIANFKAHEGKILALSVDNLNPRLISAGQDNLIKIWQIPTYNCTTVLSTSYSIAKLRYSSAAEMIWAGTENGLLCVWDINSGMLLNTIKAHSGKITALCINRMINILAAGSSDGSVSLWRLDSHKLVYRLQEENSIVKSICFSADCSKLAIGSNKGIITIREVQTGKLFKIIKAHTGPVDDMSWKIQKNNLVSVSKAERMIKTWDIETGECLLTNTIPMAQDR